MVNKAYHIVIIIVSVKHNHVHVREIINRRWQLFTCRLFEYGGRHQTCSLQYSATASAGEVINSVRPSNYSIIGDIYLRFCFDRRYYSMLECSAIENFAVQYTQCWQ